MFIFEEDTAKNLKDEIIRSRRFNCRCGIKGAALGCFEKSCRNSFHVPRAACEKAKKVLSVYAEAHIYIDSLMDEKDVMGFIKREEFEQIAAPILECDKRPLEKALVEAGLTVDKVRTVEVVGSGSRVPAIIRILTGFFQKEPRSTMNASKCVARGNALECAFLSPDFLNREFFQVNEWFPASIYLSWKVAPAEYQSTIVFRKGNSFPSVHVITFDRSKDSFSFNLNYVDAEELLAPALISTYTIGPLHLIFTRRINVTALLNLHGIVSIESAILTARDGAQIRNIPVAEHVFSGTTPLDLQKAVENEIDMASQDHVMEVTKDKRNALESYV